MDTLQVAALGPEGTFSQRAAEIAIASHPETPANIVLFPTMRKVFAALGPAHRRGVVPIENLIDGYVQAVLDLLLESSFFIVDELLLPIQFSFVANAASLSEVKRVYAQPVAEAQCRDFLDGLGGADIVATPSNGESLVRVLQGVAQEGAIVPAFALRGRRFPVIVDAVDDVANNRTRFVVLSDTAPCRDSATLSRPHKTSLVVVETLDQPGSLARILDAFAQRTINLLSIVSRPTRQSLGKYNFFIDIEGHIETPDVQAALRDVERAGRVRILGSYPRALTQAFAVR